MHISRFQLKLTLIFLLVLIIPAIVAIFLTQYILTIEKRGMNVDKKVEEVLQEASDIAYDIIDRTKEECKFIAQAIAEELPTNLRIGSSEKIRQIIKDILPPGHGLEVAILDNRTKQYIFSTSSNPKPEISDIVEQVKQEKSVISEQEADIVYGIAPIFNKGELISSVIVSKRLEQSLVRSIIDLKNVLSVYALKEEIQKYIWIIMLILVIVLAISGSILATFLARSVTKPILDLVEATKEIAKGNLDYKVNVKGKDEIAILMESFNLMASQLKSSRERLMITERLAAWRNVARQIAHEIKNLLSPIQLSMYRLKKNLGNERYNEIFEQSYTSITNEVENLKNMVTEFSNFARMPKPRTRLSSINEVVQDALNLYKELPENIEIKTDLHRDLPQLMLDSDQMRQVLHNLIGNAVDAMPTGGQISISTHNENDGNIILDITDTGCGMSEEVKQKIFTPYFTTKEKGTGLGMAIVAQIIEEHGGTISVESSQGIGTKVTISLRARQDMPLEATK